MVIPNGCPIAWIGAKRFRLSMPRPMWQPPWNATAMPSRLASSYTGQYTFAPR